MFNRSAPPPCRLCKADVPHIKRRAEARRRPTPRCACTPKGASSQPTACGCPYAALAKYGQHAAAQPQTARETFKNSQKQNTRKPGISREGLKPFTRFGGGGGTRPGVGNLKRRIETMSGLYQYCGGIHQMNLKRRIETSRGTRPRAGRCSTRNLKRRIETVGRPPGGRPGRRQAPNLKRRIETIYSLTPFLGAP